jgi:hypothetical protein
VTTAFTLHWVFALFPPGRMKISPALIGIRHGTRLLYRDPQFFESQPSEFFIAFGYIMPVVFVQQKTGRGWLIGCEVCGKQWRLRPEHVRSGKLGEGFWVLRDHQKAHLKVPPQEPNIKRKRRAGPTYAQELSKAKRLGIPMTGGYSDW